MSERDILLQAHHAAGRALERIGSREGALDHYRAATALLEEIRRGLQGPSLAGFLARPATAALGRDASRLFQNANSGADDERLRAALRP